jgi:hypothetical protein
LLPLHLNEVKDCWHGWGVVVRLCRLQTMCFWWRIMDLVEPQCMGNTIDLWLRDVWMICNLWHGYDGAGTAGFAPLRVHSAFRSDLVQRDRLRTPRSRCGAKGVVRHTSLLASVWRTAARQKLEGGSVFVTGPIQARSTPNIEMLPMLDLDVPTTKPSSCPLCLAGSDFSLYITNPTSLDFPAPTQTWCPNFRHSS